LFVQEPLHQLQSDRHPCPPAREQRNTIAEFRWTKMFSIGHTCAWYLRLGNDDAKALIGCAGQVAQLCPELVADRLEAVLDAAGPPAGSPDAGSLREQVEAAKALTDYLDRFPERERNARFEEIRECSTYSLDSWLVELLLDAGQDYPDEITRVADVMSSFRDAATSQADLALALACAGRRQEATERARANVARYPGDAWAQIHAGDVYDQLKDDEEALAMFVCALDLAADLEEWDVAAERVNSVLGRTGREDAWAGVARRHPRSRAGLLRRSAAEPAPSPTPAAPKLLLAPGRKIGRNEPCPCGSGKKYKKCCQNRR
jgi:tetratricopeptide (TPR) repeat protein